MNILVVGLGTIGSIYGYAFQEAGHEVEHYLRKGSPKAAVKQVKWSCLMVGLKKKGFNAAMFIK